MLLCAVLVYAATLLGAGASLETRTTLLRYGALFAGAVAAVVPPHVLHPDPQVRLAQRLNVRPARLLQYQLRRWAGAVALVGVPLVVLAFWDPGAWGADLAAKGARLVEIGFVAAGVLLYGFARYAVMGAASQAWQAGEKGEWYRTAKERGSGFDLPPDLVPSLLVTPQVFGAAVLAVVAAAYAEAWAGPVAAWLPGAALTAWAGAKLWRQRPAYDRHFYGTSALYAEMMSGGGPRAARRTAVAYDAVYWAPSRLRPSVWASLRQLDRRLPLGRFVALGHGGLWLLFLQGAAAPVVTAYLLIFATAKNAACALLATRSLAPPAFQMALRPPRAWAMTRWFVNLRWTLPFLLSLFVVAALDDSFGWAQALAWTGLDAALALAAAALVTGAAEGRLRAKS